MPAGCLHAAPGHHPQAPHTSHLVFQPLSPSYCLKHALCRRQRVCPSAKLGEASPFSPKKGNPGATSLPGNLASPPGSPPAAPLTVPFPTEAIGTARRRPLSKVLPTHLSVAPPAIVFSLQGPCSPPVPTRTLGPWVPPDSPVLPRRAESGLQSPRPRN
uniref:Uncharacterized protein n=1 Tax=Myotis myotis TaxID=51298 RepID=A0A7J8ANU0_MYOMY|nr:hypothetical protein mMyoMyo1_008198 [Myotis myotis]